MSTRPLDVERVLDVAARGLSVFLGDSGEAHVSEFRVDVAAAVMTSGSSETPVLTVAGPDSAAVLGHYPPFRQGEATGFLIPFLRGWMSSALPDLADWSRMLIDHDHLPQPAAVAAPYRFMGLDDALERQWVTPDSPLAVFCGRYELDVLLQAGAHIAGPSLAVLQAVETTLRWLQPGSVLDMFAGTASVTKLAASFGVERLTRVDVVPGPPPSPPGSDIHAIVGDVFELEWSDASYDLVVSDPFYGMTYAAALFMSMKGRPLVTRVLVFNGGRASLTHHQARIHSILAAGYAEVSSTDAYGERIYICQGGRDE